MKAEPTIFANELDVECERGVRNDAKNDCRFDLVPPLVPHCSYVCPNPLTWTVRSFII